MPRPNPPRTIASEHTLARRLAFERERRGMSYDGLASRMTKAGCPIQSSALYKIEKAGRRITVNELSALSKVFDMPFEELLEDPAGMESREWARLVRAVLDAHDRADEAVEALDEAVRRLQQYAVEHPEVVEPFRSDPAMSAYLTMEV